MLTSSITSSRPSDQTQLNIPPGKDHKHTYNTMYKPSFKLYQGFDDIANKTEVVLLIDIFMFVIIDHFYHPNSWSWLHRSLFFHHLSSFLPFVICFRHLLSFCHLLSCYHFLSFQSFFHRFNKRKQHTLQDQSHIPRWPKVKYRITDNN